MVLKKQMIAHGFESHPRREAEAELKRIREHFPSVIGTLAYLAGLRDVNDGHYEVASLTERLGRERAHCVLLSVHEMIFREWLSMPSNKRLADIKAYLASLPCGGTVAIRTWRVIEPHRMFLPASVSADERRIYLDLMTSVLSALAIGSHVSGATGSEQPGCLSRHVACLASRVSEDPARGSALLQEVSREHGVSVRHLRRVFREEIGMGLRAYLKEVRMRHARELLRSPAITLKEIAALVGYSDVSNFGHAFCSVHGVSPRRFRDIIASAGQTDVRGKSRFGGPLGETP